MDLSKAFDTISHDLMIAKPKTYGFSGKALKFMQSYLKSENKDSRLTTNLILKKMLLLGSIGFYRWTPSF